MSVQQRFAVYPSLRDQLVLITGGATGIGASLVEHFALQGSQVAFLDIDQKNAEQLVAALSSEMRTRASFSTVRFDRYCQAACGHRRD